MMKLRCAAYSCKSGYNDTGSVKREVSFHAFPPSNKSVVGKYENLLRIYPSISVT